MEIFGLHKHSPLGVSCVGFRHANMSPSQFLNSQLEEELEDMTMSTDVGLRSVQFPPESTRLRVSGKRRH
ncbi:hypothetical protein DAPPUDRAFT_274533 [Daphnia pulex]|uniref:Uncharacterized protein n=1 Tax=Daphnia pulex TaxID=6669 RepID=E9I4C8_DAPPU|nr:hypothetical protein DAPPUDRAFT_274533 [Daphnia pulex]|eukprot:EFX61152.1 hypothetical protein DAPPUDRAFT_274533 [Daphnia pulex]